MSNVTPFLIGHHDSKRDIPISTSLVQQAHAANVRSQLEWWLGNTDDPLQYDMLTFPITTPKFHSRVLSVLSTLFSSASISQSTTSSASGTPVTIEPLSPIDTQLTPDESISSIVGVTSAWIDLSSPDPVIADVSRQVLRLELAYAAFCGISYVIIHGPRHNDSADIVAYARAILDGLNQGPYMQLYLWTSTHGDLQDYQGQVGDLASFARQEYVTSHASNEDSNDEFRTWQDWDTVRSICQYSTRLNLGTVAPVLH